MTIALIIFYLTIASYFACLWKIFQKAGQPSKAGFIPVYNLLIWLRLMRKPWWWLLLLIVPGINFLMLTVMHLELVRSFGKRNLPWYLLAVFLPPMALYLLAFGKDAEYTGLPDYKKEKKGAGREWAEAIVFAIVAATIIRTFFIEAFTIPTPSMEKSLLVGDYLFVSKLSYGPRLPMTPIAVPLTHHTVPVLNIKSYTEWQKLPYMRLPGWGDVKRYDATVFNFPAGDTVAMNWQDQTYYQLLRTFERKNVENPRFAPLKPDATGAQRATPMGEIVGRPIDKRENYIKRTIGLPGETLEVRSRKIIIDGNEIEDPEGLLYRYIIYTKTTFSRQVMKDKYGIDINAMPAKSGSYNIYELHLKESEATVLQQFGSIDTMFIYPVRPSSDLRIYPNHPDYSWTEDDFGPLWIPAEGATVELTLQNLPLYQRPIEVYEGNTLEVRNGEIYINGELASSYTFRQNYYFLMGDNRHNSADSRYWGFVPHDHVVGKAVFVWFSKEAGGRIRWERVFTKAR